MYEHIPGRLAEIRNRIADAAGRAGRLPESVRLIAVSKTHPCDAVRAAADAGQLDFGENKVQEALQKIAQSADTRLRWHLIGHLQSNKAGKAAAACTCIHAIDSVDLLRRVEDLLKPPGQIGGGELEKCLQAILSFPDSPATPDQGEAQHFSSYHPRVAFHRFRAGLPVPVAWPAAWWRKLRTVMEAGYEPKGSRENEAVKSDAPPSAGTFEHHYGAAKDRASTLSEAFGDAHRGGILWSYLLAAGAVFLALAGIYLHQLHAPAGLLVAVAVAELLTIAVLWALAETAKFEDWHEAYTDIRILAEAVRHMKYLGPLGVHAPMPKLPPHLAGTAGPSPGPAPTHDPRRLWSVWYFRALVRTAPLQLVSPPAASPEELRKVLLEKWIGNPDPQSTPARRGSQTEYHRRNRHVQSGFLHRLETLAEYGFVIVFAAALIHAADAWHAFRHPTDHTPVAGTGVGILFTICFWLGVGGPALLAAITGFLSQIEAMRLRQRSVGMTLLLAERHRVLSALDLATAPEAVEARWRLAAEAAITAGLMVDETAGWALIYKSADIHAG